MSYKISIIQDTRRAKVDQLFPVKLRVYSTLQKKAKLYSLGMDLTQLDFQHIWVERASTGVRGKNKDIRLSLQSFELRAEEEAQKLKRFTFDQFEKKYFRRASDSRNVFYHFQLAIDNSIKKNKVGTANSYRYAMNSIYNYEMKRLKSNIPLRKLDFETITPDWLDGYEDAMLSENKSVTTIGIYLRSLRVIFNNAIEQNDLEKEAYPFGKRKYQIPESKRVRKALTKEQLKLLFHSEPQTYEQEKAKDFWFFSYACNGMNLKDICHLKYSDIKDGKFTYYRAKTFKKTRARNKIVIFLTEFISEIIEKYGTEDPSGYIFPILSMNSDAQENHRKVKNFTRFVNQHIKKLAKANKLPIEISSYWARHSFATNAIRKGATMEYVSEALNHSDLRVTKNYFAGFEDKTKKDFADKLMDF